MKVLWLCNSAPGVVRSHISGKQESAVNWVDHVLSGLRQQGLTVRILYRGSSGSGQIDAGCSYASIGEGLPYVYEPELEARFREELRTFRPDVIHSWGVEYSHTLAMVNAAEKEEMLPHMAASIQGLCGFIAEHYADGIPARVQNRASFRDFVRKDNIRQQQEKFRLRGTLESQAVEKLQHIIGRTHWDKNCINQINPKAEYHFCNETLREDFYKDTWQYAGCQKHRIFASSCSYPVKGFHYLLEAFREVRKVYPDAVLSVTGRNALGGSFKEKLRRGTYENYLAGLIRKNHLEDSVEFLGDLNAKEMKQAYLDANVFVLPSTIENSPNSLCEAMLLGLPCVAADVGGVTSLIRHQEEGLVYQAGDVQKLTEYILDVFAREDAATKIGQAARVHALQNHDPEHNLQTLLEIYRKLV